MRTARRTVHTQASVAGGEALKESSPALRCEPPPWGASVKEPARKRSDRIIWLKAKVAEIDAALARPVAGIVLGTKWPWKSSEKHRLRQQQEKLRLESEVAWLESEYLLEQRNQGTPTSAQDERKENPADFMKRIASLFRDPLRQKIALCLCINPNASNRELLWDLSENHRVLIPAQWAPEDTFGVVRRKLREAGLPCNPPGLVNGRKADT